MAGLSAPLELGAHVLEAFWLGPACAFVDVDAHVHITDAGGTRAGMARASDLAEGEAGDAAAGALAAVAGPHPGSLLLGLDDGRLVELRIDGTRRTWLRIQGRWMERLAVAPTTGLVACSAGRETVLLRPDGTELRRIAHDSSVGGLAFDERGKRLAIALYRQVQLWWANEDAAQRPVELPWAGAHQKVTFTPDGRFVISAMQENALHGWRLADKADMRMSGYPAKTKSFSWSVKGKWLATSGADRVVAWPFQGKDGPMGRPPRELGGYEALVTIVACHPSQEIVAAGCADGAVYLLRFSDGAEIELAPAAPPERRKDAAVTALGWDEAGEALAFARADGWAQIASL